MFDSFDVDIAGKTGTAEKVVDGGLADQSWWCGGPYDSPELVVCAADRERRSRRHGGGPGRRKVFERTRRPRRPHRPGDLRLSVLTTIDIAAHALARRRRSRLTRDEATFVRRLDWILFGAALIGVGLWAIAGITKYDVAGNEGYFVTRQVVFVALGGIG